MGARATCSLLTWRRSFALYQVATLCLRTSAGALQAGVSDDHRIDREFAPALVIQTESAKSFLVFSIFGLHGWVAERGKNTWPT